MREQTRHGLQEQKLMNAQSTKQQSQHMLLQKKEREAAERQANLERSSYLKQRKDEVGAAFKTYIEETYTYIYICGIL